MESGHVLPQSFPGGTHIGTGGTLDTATVHMFRLYVMFHMTSILRGKGALKAHPESCGRLLHVARNDFIQA